MPQGQLTICRKAGESIISSRRISRTGRAGLLLRMPFPYTGESPAIKSLKKGTGFLLRRLNSRVTSGHGKYQNWMRKMFNILIPAVAHTLLTGNDPEIFGCARFLPSARPRIHLPVLYYPCHRARCLLQLMSSEILYLRLC